LPLVFDQGSSCLKFEKNDNIINKFEEVAMRRLAGKEQSRAFFVLTLILFLGSLIFAEKGAKIAFKEESWDFGKVKQGQVLNHVFKLKNIGDEPLKIKDVSTSCGCTAALVSNAEILPGKEGEIKVTIDTRGYTDKITKYVFVESNDPAQYSKELTVTAEIEVPPTPRMFLDKSYLDLGLILDQDEIQARAKIENKGELELKVTCSHQHASFYSRGKILSFPLKIAAGKAEEIEIRIPPQKKTGLMREFILIRSNDPLRPNLSLALSAYLVSPKQLKELFAKYKDILK